SMNAGRRPHLKLTSNLGDGGWFLVRLNVPPDELKNSSLLSCYGHLTSSPLFSLLNKFSLTTENSANILEHVRRGVKCFLQTGSRDVGETVTVFGSVVAP